MSKSVKGSIWGRRIPALGVLASSILLVACGGGGGGGGGSEPSSPGPDTGPDLSQTFSQGQLQGLLAGTRLTIVDATDPAKSLSLSADGAFDLSSVGLDSVAMKNLKLLATNTDDNRAYSNNPGLPGLARNQTCEAADADGELAVQCRETLFFAIGPLGKGGNELWRTDGTAVGTRRVSIPAGEQSMGQSRINWLSEFNNQIFFRAETDQHGNELWVSDGTAKGTRLLKDINPDNSEVTLQGRSSEPSFLVPVGDWLVFEAKPGRDQPRSLWRTNGKVTEEFYRFDNAGPGLSANTATVLDGRLYFAMGRYDGGQYISELWRTEGSADSTQRVLELGRDEGLISEAGKHHWLFVQKQGDRLYFAQQDYTGNKILKYLTPETESAPVTVFDLDAWLQAEFAEASVKATILRSVAEAGEALYFQVQLMRQQADGDVELMYYQPSPNSTTLTTQLWRTDGTEEGTRLIPPYDTGKSDYYTVGHLGLNSGLLLDDSLHFGAHELDIQREQIRSADVDFSRHRLTKVGSRLFGHAENGKGYGSLWMTDGTQAGTHQVMRGGTAPGTRAAIGVSGISDYGDGSLALNDGVVNGRLLLSLKVIEPGRDQIYPSIWIVDDSGRQASQLLEITDL
ncbi:hypothetical protein KUV44_14535 [Marinobacter daepoensis]|uniref:ELWxxDGT repeat-containing protein n=1 Tax=Marinobacter daepoensis TaxID=262077 RepID=A0ABS3BEF9_9GAMM|nr:hypothetical protein [Marinobacter daepoensis]MBN7769976.1 hypothetical protein [Marinobacter daepoensis]MBY6080364.1 hypothetical protein [Marinobacter daepoensis]